MTHILYFSLTSLRGEFSIFGLILHLTPNYLATQTLGEEYVGMWPYDYTSKSFPTRKVRHAYVYLAS